MRKRWLSGMERNRRSWDQMGKTETGKDGRTSIKNVWKWAPRWRRARTNTTGSRQTVSKKLQHGNPSGVLLLIYVIHLETNCWICLISDALINVCLKEDIQHVGQVRAGRCEENTNITISLILISCQYCSVDRWCFNKMLSLCEFW